MKRLVLTLLLCFYAISVTSQAHASDDRIKELEAENQALRSELAQLRLQLSQLKREMQQLQKRQQQAEPKEVIEEDGQQDKQHEGEPKIRTFRSADEIYRSIPESLAPERDGWSRTKKRNVGEWLKENLPGQQFSARRTINSVSVRYDGLKKDWRVQIDLKYQPMTFNGWKMQERLTRVVLRGDEAFAAKAERTYKVGMRVQVSGTIASIGWDFFSAHPHGSNWKPKYCTITLGDVEVR